jgi:hypothetical protein
VQTTASPRHLLAAPKATGHEDEEGGAGGGPPSGALTLPSSQWQLLVESGTQHVRAARGAPGDALAAWLQDASGRGRINRLAFWGPCPALLGPEGAELSPPADLPPPLIALSTAPASPSRPRRRAPRTL